MTVFSHLWISTQEYKVFGNYGCSDCGFVTEVTVVGVSLTTQFQTEIEGNASSWNLYSPTLDVHWYSTPQTFTSQESTVASTVYLMDAQWQVQITATNGGVGGTVTAYPYTSVTNATTGLTTETSMTQAIIYVFKVWHCPCYVV